MADQDLYQQIWDEDVKNGNGIMPVVNEEEGNKDGGYIVVDDKETTDKNHKIFPNLHIPARKLKSYELVSKLFNNYSLDPKEGEDNILSESEEVEEFLNFVINSKPMKLTKKIIEERSQIDISESQWFTYLYNLWFRKFSTRKGRDLSGFEHIFVGEGEGRTLGGHHFWYTYHLEDSVNSDHTIYLGPRYECANPESPDVVTIGYEVEAMDFVKKEYTSLVKKIGGFFVGLSAEGIMALGTLRFTPQAYAPKEAFINSNHYQMKLFRSQDNQSIRTFYPVYLCR
ncbi:hypothetical protein V7174_12190 [Bacillus subtilis]|uniref:hypothetical protein n=1 Tax=Bacillus subtilis TaxID=1423 RepID=UPI002DBB64F8|nr:hypothetical protein [Bacillus subtilis]MEC2198087.1 hypothetical protein [Bacillus subtilis]MEC2331812.1 hypothetical protein [Bacillus subtilis]